MVKLRNAIAISLLLRRSLASTVTDLCAPPHLLDILHLKNQSRTFFVSSKDYLVSSLSISPQSIEDLEIKRKPYSIKSTSNADSVISLFTDYGFSHTHSAKIFSLCPFLLTFDPHDNLKPKLDFLGQRGISGGTLIHIATRDPYFLKHSLQKRIVPFLDFLQTSFSSNNPQALNSFFLQNRATHIFLHFSENTAVNLETLRLHGVPESTILRLFLLGGGPTFLAHDPEYFSQNLKEIMDMGFDLYVSHVFCVYCGMSKEKWISKMKLVKEFLGWTNDEQLLALFVKQHSFMKLSLENLRKSLEFFVKRLGWTPNYIAQHPHLLAYSFESRIFPRISVLEILQSKGLVKKLSIPSAFRMSEDMFLSKFVNKYQKDLPKIQLVEIYTKSMPNSEFGGSI